MRKIDWKFVIEVTGIAAIVASLVFVGLEMRQTRMLAMAAAYQARSDSELAIEIAQLESGIRYEMLRRIRSGEQLEPEDVWWITHVLNMRLMYWENAHYQWENGLLTDSFWRVNENSIRVFMHSQVGHDYWQQNRLLWRDTFRSAVDEIMTEWSQSQTN